MALHHLSDFVAIRERFHRSVHLIRDFRSKQIRSGYVLTSIGRQLLDRISDSVLAPSDTRAWTITGPYGSGKSSFSLFMAKVLCNGDGRSPLEESVRRELGLAKTAPLLPVMVVGRRSSIADALLEALAVAAADSLHDPKLESSLISARNRSARESEAIDLTDRVATQAAKKGFGGVLLVLDEFGKFLEYAALHPEEEDVFLMQGLAEFAARSEFPFVIVNVLHSAFSDYLPAGDQVRRAEWNKVQGRFQDVAFLEPPEQLLGLVRESLKVAFPKNLRKSYESAIRSMVDHPGFDEARRKLHLDSEFEGLVPLHPLVALLLWPVFRSELAQNERSLFSFLSSREPLGFLDFLQRTEASDTPAFFGLDRLYDYVTSSLGMGLFRGTTARRWTEIGSALDRLASSAPKDAATLVKAVGLLSIHGASVGLSASREILNLVVENRRNLEEALEYLDKRSIVVYRKHQSAYGLWEGSDVDLDVVHRRARAQVEGESITGMIEHAMDLRPIVARSYYFETGTLRSFDVTVVPGDPVAMEKACSDQTGRDGKVMFVMSSSASDRKRSIATAKQLTADAPESSVPLIFAVPRPVSGLEDSLIDVETWRWALANYPELNGDPVARKEVLSRLHFAEDRLREAAGATFGLRGAAFDPRLSTWISQGRAEPIRSAPEFLRWLSEQLFATFSSAPNLDNELLNREALSSAAAAARTLLVKAMVAHEGEPRVGIEGTPAEVSMYEAMLAVGGFHREVDGQLRFTDPVGTWEPVWEQIEHRLEENGPTRVPVRHLFDELRKPPFGVREGPLVVLLVAFLMARKNSVALYQGGVYVPDLRDEILELLSRNPHDFEVQKIRFASDDERKLLALAEALANEAIDLDAGTERLISVVRGLVVFAARLPSFTRTSRKLTPTTMKVREALLHAKDPHELVFEVLPAIFEGGDRDWVAGVAEAVRELRRAYPELLDSIERQMREAFALPTTSEEARAELQSRCKAMLPFVSEQTLSLFVRETARLDRQDWREVLARVVLKGLAPDRWTDREAVEFQPRLVQLRSDFLRLEELVAEAGHAVKHKVLRIGVLDGRYKEAREILPVVRENRKVVDRLAERVREVLEDVDAGGRDVRLAALAEVLFATMNQPPEPRRHRKND